MRTKIFLSLLMICAISISVAQDSKSARISESLNTNWLFNYAPQKEIQEEFIQTNFDDSEWTLIGIPHTWQTFETAGEEHPYIKSAAERDDPYWWKGWGYYRKTISIDKKQLERNLSIEFEGVQKYCRLFINGILVK